MVYISGHRDVLMGGGADIKSNQFSLLLSCGPAKLKQFI